LKKILNLLMIIGNLYAFNFSNFIRGGVLSYSDENKANNTNNCYNAFSIDSFMNASYIPSIITQIQNQKFYLYITNKCINTKDLKISLIDGKTGESIGNYNIQRIGNTIIRVNVHNSYKNLLVHFIYKIYKTRDKKVSCKSNAYKLADKHNKYMINYPTKECHIIQTILQNTRQENSTDNFAVRPKEFQVYVDNNITLVEKPLKINITAIGENGIVSTNYNESDIYLNTNITDSNTYLSYFYNIKNGKIDNYRFFFTRPSNDVKIQISEKVGKEWARVDRDDTTNNRRLIYPGISNSIKIYETSKKWAGTAIGNKVDETSKNSINSNIRINRTQNLKFHKMTW